MFKKCARNTIKSRNFLIYGKKSFLKRTPLAKGGIFKPCSPFGFWPWKSLRFVYKMPAFILA